MNKDLDILARIKPVDLGWLAGIIEGEGSIVLREGPKNSHWAVIRVAMTDLDIVMRLRKVTGRGKLTYIQPTQPHHKPQYQWALGARADVTAILRLIYPLMGHRRKERITAALEYLDAYPTPPKKGENNKNAKLTSAQVAEIREAYNSKTATIMTLAKQYGVSFQNISKIVRGERWAA